MGKPCLKIKCVREIRCGEQNATVVYRAAITLGSLTGGTDSNRSGRLIDEVTVTNTAAHKNRTQGTKSNGVGANPLRPRAILFERSNRQLNTAANVKLCLDGKPGGKTVKVSL